MSHTQVQNPISRPFIFLSLAALALSASLGVSASAQRILPASPSPLLGAPRTQPLVAQTTEALPDLPESLFLDTPAPAQKLAVPDSAAAELARGCQGNLLKNGDIGTFTMSGSTNFPPSIVPGWNSAVYTPQISPTPGHGGAKGWLAAWGYRDGGESFSQNVNLAPGTYKLTLATRQYNGVTNPTPAQYRVAFRSGSANSNPWGVPGTVTLDSPPMTNAGWAVQSYTFNLGSATNVMQVNTFNVNPSSVVNGHPERVSWTAYDSFCLQQVKPEGRRRGMTWVVREVREGLVNVGNHAATNPYLGDTLETQVLPMLCILQSNLPVPAGIVPDYYHGWSKGEVRLTTPIPGSVMNSPALADGLCAGQFGPGWRMGEFHDGAGGHSYWARGNLDAAFKAQTKFWAAIGDQPANVWNSVP